MYLASLKKQAISSIKWTSLQTTIVSLTGPILLIVKAHFLSPEEFGYLAVILIVIGLFNLLESFGINQAIIQRDKISKKQSSSLFYFNVLLCSFLATVLYLVSPLVAAFFSLPILEDYLPVVCIIILVSGPFFLFQAFLEKNLCFKQLSLIAIYKSLIILGSTTLFLFSGLGVLGIIYSQLIGVIFASLSVFFITIRFKTTSLLFYFNPLEVIPFLRFGLFIFAKQLMTFITQRLDEVLIGYFLTPEILGIYHFGKNMLEMVRSLISMSFGKVLFPVFSKLKHNPQILTLAYQRISRYIAFVAFPVFTGIAATAHLFVPLIFGDKWIGSIIVFQVFSITLILMALTANVSTTLLYSVNKPDQVFYIDLVTNALYFASLFLFVSHGMLAILSAYSCYVVYKTITLQYYANRQLVDGFIRYFNEIFIPAISAIVMVLAVLVFQLVSTKTLTQTLQLVGSIIIGILIYSLMTWFFARDTLIQLRSAIVHGDFVEK